MTGFALTKFDRALAQIDRVLAGELTLPVGGPVVEPFEAPWCWADWTPGSGLPAYPSCGGYYCGLKAQPDKAGLCNVHHELYADLPWAEAAGLRD